MAVNVKQNIFPLMLKIFLLLEMYCLLLKENLTSFQILNSIRKKIFRPVNLLQKLFIKILNITQGSRVKKYSFS